MRFFASVVVAVLRYPEGRAHAAGVELLQGLTIGGVEVAECFLAVAFEVAGDGQVKQIVARDDLRWRPALRCWCAVSVASAGGEAGAGVATLRVLPALLRAWRWHPVAVRALPPRLPLLQARAHRHRWADGPDYRSDRLWGQRSSCPVRHQELSRFRQTALPARRISLLARGAFSRRRSHLRRVVGIDREGRRKSAADQHQADRQ